MADVPGAAGLEQLGTPEAMLDNLFSSIINDADRRSRITAILDQVGENLTVQQPQRL